MPNRKRRLVRIVLPVHTRLRVRLPVRNVLPVIIPVQKRLFVRFVLTDRHPVWELRHVRRAVRVNIPLTVRAVWIVLPVRILRRAVSPIVRNVRSIRKARRVRRHVRNVLRVLMRRKDHLPVRNVRRV